MGAPEDNPADAIKCFPCKYCEDGDVMEIDGNWECNRCGKTPGDDN